MIRLSCCDIFEKGSRFTFGFGGRGIDGAHTSLGGLELLGRVCPFGVRHVLSSFFLKENWVYCLPSLKGNGLLSFFVGVPIEVIIFELVLHLIVRFVGAAELGLLAVLILDE